MNDVSIEAAWQVLRTSPLTLLVVTLASYQAGRWLRERTGGAALAQPCVVAIAAVAAYLTVADVDYATYAQATRPIAFLLGPATVALAVPLHAQAHRLRGSWLAILVAVPAGVTASVVSVVWIARALGAGELLQRSLAPKGSTAPVAIALADEIGGIPELAGVFAILVGILGAVAAPLVLRLMRVRDPEARGVAVGVVSHGIGTSRLLHDDAREGAFGGLGMGLAALATAVLVPLLAALLF